MPDQPKMYKSLVEAQEALDRGEVVRIEMESREIDPQLLQLAQDIQDREQLVCWRENMFEGVLATSGYPGDGLTREALEEIAAQAIGRRIDSTIWHGWPHGWWITSTKIEDRGSGRFAVIAYCASVGK